MNAPVQLHDLTDIPRFLLRGTPENDAFLTKSAPTTSSRFPPLKSAEPVKTTAPAKSVDLDITKSIKPKKLRLTTTQVNRLKSLGYGKRRRARMSRDEAEFTIMQRIKNPHAILTAPDKHKKK